MTLPTSPMGNAHLLPISPAQAAHIAKVSRRTVMRAIENLELKASRDNRNRWRIHPDDLRRWANAQWAPTGHAHPEMPTYAHPEVVADLREKLALATARADAAERARDQAEADRDQWRQMAMKLSNRPRRSFWPWKRRTEE